MQSALLAPFQLANTDVLVTASMGSCSRHPPTARRKTCCVRPISPCARPKKGNRHRMKVFHAWMLEEAVKVMEVERDMPNALKNGEFRMLYQPIVSLENKTLTGVEALIRWQHPTRGLLSPDAFLPIAEQNDFIVQLGAWALRQACADMRTWQEQHEEMTHLNVSVNLSARQLAQHDIVDVVKHALAESGIPARSRSSSKSPRPWPWRIPNARPKSSPASRPWAYASASTISAPAYSSLSYLQSFPIDTLKVDKRFIDAMEHNTSKRKIVRSVIDLAHTARTRRGGRGHRNGRTMVRAPRPGLRMGPGLPVLQARAPTPNRPAHCPGEKEKIKKNASGGLRNFLASAAGIEQGDSSRSPPLTPPGIRFRTTAVPAYLASFL